MVDVCKLLVVPDVGDPYAVTVDMRTILKWETSYHRSFTDIVDKPALSANNAYELAYVGAQRQKLPVPDHFKEFKEANEVLDFGVWSKMVEAQQKRDAEKAKDDPDSEEDDDEGEAAEVDTEEVSTEPDPTQSAPSTEP